MLCRQSVSVWPIFTAAYNHVHSYGMGILNDFGGICARTPHALLPLEVSFPCSVLLAVVALRAHALIQSVALAVHAGL